MDGGGGGGGLSHMPDQWQKNSHRLLINYRLACMCVCCVLSSGLSCLCSSRSVNKGSTIYTLNFMVCLPGGLLDIRHCFQYGPTPPKFLFFLVKVEMTLPPLLHFTPSAPLNHCMLKFQGQIDTFVF